MDNTTTKRTVLKKAILVSLLILNIVFFVYWCLLAYYSRLHFDDLHFLWKLREMSIFDYVKEMYYTRSGRFVAYVINGIMARVTDNIGTHVFWAIFYYILGIGICCLVVRDIDLPVSKSEKILGICLFYNLYVLTNIDFPVFYWLCAMTYYLCFPISCLLLAYLNKATLSWREWLVLILSAIFIGGGNEAFTPVFLVVLFCCGLFWWHSQRWNVKKTWALPQIKRIILSATIVVVFFIVVVIAPGNYDRMSDTSQFIHPVGLSGWVKAVMNAMVLFFYHMTFYLPYLFILFLLSCCVGSRLSVKLPHNKYLYIIYIALGFLFYLFVSCIPNAFLYGGFGIQRTYTHVVCALILSICLIGLVSGIGNKRTTPEVLSLFGSIALVAIMIINLIQDTPSARKYACAVDERIEYLRHQEENGQKSTVKVAALPIPYTEDTKHFVLSRIGIDSPRPVLYYISDTDIIPNEYEFHMKNVLGLGFDFVLE